ncbi:MAG: flagellar basal-body MS-ring/collar protein FliF [Desulfovibrio sp.]
MASFLNSFADQVKSYWTNRTKAQQALIGGLAVAVVLSFAMMIFWLNQPDYKVLYTKLFPEDAAKVVELLKAQKEQYKLADNGQTILVPIDRVYDLRLKIAGEGNLHGQGIGFEIFDNLKIGQTDFVQHINYQRALQGELARTISEFPEIERARVHLVIPNKSLFIEDQVPPSGSVVLKLNGDQELEQSQIQGIVNLVAMSVEGLDKANVSLTDMKGRLLYQGQDEENGIALSSTQMEFKAAMERKIERRIQELLMPIAGPQKVIARVNAELDFSQKTIRRELFDPDSAVVRSETKSAETTSGNANVNAGVPEPNFRGDGFSGTQTTQDSTRETSTTNFEINKEELNIVTPVGELKRISVAVIIDGTYVTDPDTGEVVYTPRSEEELEKYRALVQSAVGYDTARGDLVEISNVSFGAPEIDGGDTLTRTILEYAQRLGKPFLNGLLVFLFLILIVRPVIMALIRPRVAEEEIEEVAGLPGAERLALDESEVDEEALDTNLRLENAKNHALQLTEENMDQVIRLFKTWVHEED